MQGVDRCARAAGDPVSGHLQPVQYSDRAAVQLLLDLCHRGALRLQPHDAQDLLARCVEVLRRLDRNQRRAAGSGLLAVPDLRSAVLDLGHAGRCRVYRVLLDVLQQPDRAPIQQADVAARGRTTRRHHGGGREFWLQVQGHLHHRWQQALDQGQRLLHGLRPQKAHRALRHAAGPDDQRRDCRRAGP